MSSQLQNDNMVFFPAVITFTIKVLWYWIHIELMVRNGNSIACNVTEDSNQNLNVSDA